MTDRIKPCPFCGNTDIRFSVKTTTIRYKRAYHFAMYCPKCNCYGARVLWKYDGKMSRTNIENNEEFKQLAINKWNTRKPMDRIVEQLEEEKYRGMEGLEPVRVAFNFGINKAIEIIKEGGE